MYVETNPLLICNTGRDGTGRDGTGRDGTGRDGTGRDGTGRDGTGRDGTGRDGTGRDGTGRGRTDFFVRPNERLLDLDFYSAMSQRYSFEKFNGNCLYY